MSCCGECEQKSATLGRLGWLGNVCVPGSDCTPYGPAPTPYSDLTEQEMQSEWNLMAEQERAGRSGTTPLFRITNVLGAVAAVSLIGLGYRKAGGALAVVNILDIVSRRAIPAYDRWSAMNVPFNFGV